MAGGPGLLDADGDGKLDLFQVRVPPPGEEAITSRLFLQREGEGFADVSAEAGLGAHAGYGQGLAVGDVENDGDADVYVTNLGPDFLFLNDGAARFEERSAAAGLSGELWSTAATFLDHDADGDLDLFVVHYLAFDETKACFAPSSRRDYCGPQSFQGVGDRLWENRGDGTFVDATVAAGMVLPDGGARAKGLGLLACDFSGDGFTDVFVANDGESNQLWVNRGDGTFAEEGILRGVAVSGTGQPEASMGVTGGDLDRDGRLDLFMTHLYKENNRLYMGTGGPLLKDASRRSGLSGRDLEYTGFGCGFLDVDNDGNLDLAVANGAINARVRQRSVLPGAPEGFWGLYAEPNQLYLNAGGGRMNEVDGGRFTARVEVSRGLAWGDVDGDGALDVVLSNVDNRLRLYLNRAAGEARSFFVRALEGPRDALGAGVRLVTSEGERVAAVVPASSYLSSVSPRVHFGLGKTAVVEEVVVHWVDGSREAFPVATDAREVTVTKGTGERR